MFVWTAAVGHWTAQDVTASTGRSVTGRLTAWQTRDGPYAVEHLAGRSAGGSLLVFYRSSRDDRWKVVDVTGKTGRRVADALTSWQTRSGPYNVEHLAGRDAAGNLLVFWWSPAHDWQAINASARTGRRIASPTTSWQKRRNGVNTEYVAGTAADGRVVIFGWTRATDWRAQVLGVRLPGGVTSWAVAAVERLAGADASGSLTVLVRPNGRTWKTVRVTRTTGERIQGPPMAYQVRDGSELVELLAARSPAGHLILHWWKGSRDWQALDLTDVTGHGAGTGPVGWLTKTGSRTVEHLALNGADGRLRVFYSFDQVRTLTDAVGRQYESIKRLGNATRKVLVVLMDQHYPNPLGRPSAAAVRETIFGDAKSVRGFFLENSGRRFMINKVRTLGWYEADKPTSYYDSHDRMGAALRAADPDIDFGQYDSNNDGKLEPSELAVYFLHPGRPGGLGRTGSRSIKDVDGGDLKLDGVLIREGMEGGIGNPPNLGVVAHELSHPLLGLPDMYAQNKDGGYFTPTAPAQYSLMDGTYAPFHIDPFNKLKLGWAQPRLVFRSGSYVLPDIETRNRVLVLLDPSRGTREYFLVENRYPGSSYDLGLFDQGLGVWHIMEERSVYDSAPPPPTVSLSDWAKVGLGQWGRKAIRMLRPDVSPPLDDHVALWDGSNYALTSDDPDPLHSSLRWGDGTSSGFALHDLGMAAPDFGLSVDVPAMP